MSKTKTQPVECVHPMPSTIHSGSALSRIRAPIKTNHIKTREAKQEVAHIPSCPPTSPHRAPGPRPALCCAVPTLGSKEGMCPDPQLQLPRAAPSTQERKGGVQLYQASARTSCLYQLITRDRKNQMLSPNAQQMHRMHTHIFHQCCSPQHNARRSNYAQTLLNQEERQLKMGRGGRGEPFNSIYLAASLLPQRFCNKKQQNKCLHFTRLKAKSLERWGRETINPLG